MPAGWNCRQFTQNDFDRLCAIEGVRVFVCRMRDIDGCYCVYDQTPLIFLSDRLANPHKLHVEFHELGHHLLHFPETQFFLDLKPKREFEANIFAACALIPLPLLLARSAAEIHEESGHSAELIAFRMRLFKEWGI